MTTDELESNTGLRLQHTVQLLLKVAFGLSAFDAHGELLEGHVAVTVIGDPAPRRNPLVRSIRSSPDDRRPARRPG
jgi:hypothetical protein